MSVLPFFKRMACQADFAATLHTTLPSMSYSTTLPSLMCGTRIVPARVIRMCRNWPCMPVIVVGIGISFSVLPVAVLRSEEHTSQLQSLRHLVCRLLLEKKKTTHMNTESSSMFLRYTYRSVLILCH